MVRNSSVMFSLYLTVFLLYLYNLLIGGLLVQVKVNGTSFYSDYSPGLYFASVCVNYNSFTSVRINSGNSCTIILLTAMEEFAIYASALRL